MDFTDKDDQEEVLARNMLVLKSPFPGLTIKQRRFVEAFDGNVTRSAKIAGYLSPSESGKRLLSNPHVIEAIKAYSITRKEAKELRATKEEREIFFTSIMRNIDPDYKAEIDPMTGQEITDEHKNIDLKDRMKAAEYLGKMNGDFIEKVQLDASTSLSDLIAASYKTKKTIEEIEAEYEANRLKEREAIPEAEIVEKESNDLGDLI